MAAPNGFILTAFKAGKQPRYVYGETPSGGHARVIYDENIEGLQMRYLAAVNHFNTTVHAPSPKGVKEMSGEERGAVLANALGTHGVTRKQLLEAPPYA